MALAVAMRTLRGSGFAKWNLGLGLFALSWLLMASHGYLPDSFTPAQADALLLAALCLQLAAVILLMLREAVDAKIRHQALFDPLTDLFNRRAFLELAERELARARRAQAPLAVLMMDLDFFKRINDAFGHQAGDQVLVEFSAIVRRSVRAEDLVGRYGGEEFCAVLPGSGMRTALEIADRIRAGVNERPLAGLSRGITVSIGAVACDPKAPFTLHAAIARADEALYRAKKQGRDRVVGLDFEPASLAKPRAFATGSIQPEHPADFTQELAGAHAVGAQLLRRPGEQVVH